MVSFISNPPIRFLLKNTYIKQADGPTPKTDSSNHQNTLKNYCMNLAPILWRVDFTTERAEVGGTHMVDDDEQDVGSLISNGSVPASRRSSAGTNREQAAGREDQERHQGSPAG
jgi:hypothetical protein